MEQKKIGAFIARRRKALKLTQAQLAERLGVTDKAVSKWETGRCLPDAALMEENRFIYQNRFPREVYDRYVRIPRDPGAEPLSQVPWNED